MSENQSDVSTRVASHELLCFGVPCNPQAWLDSPERVMRHFREDDLDADGVTAREINRRRWGSAVDVRVDIEELKACARHGLVRCEKGKWFILHNAEAMRGKSDTRTDQTACSPSHTLPCSPSFE